MKARGRAEDKGLINPPTTNDLCLRPYLSKLKAPDLFITASYKQKTVTFQSVCTRPSK